MPYEGINTLMILELRQSSPIVLVRKKDENLCLSVDYRLLNSKTRKDAWMHSLGLAGFPPSTWPVVTTRFLWQNRTSPKLHSVHHLAFLSSIACPLEDVW